MTWPVWLAVAVGFGFPTLAGFMTLILTYHNRKH